MTKNGTLVYKSRYTQKSRRVIVKGIHTSPRGRIIGHFFVGVNKHYVTTIDGQNWTYVD